MTDIRERLLELMPAPQDMESTDKCSTLQEAVNVIDKLMEALLLIRNDVKSDQGRLSDMAWNKVHEAIKAVNNGLPPPPEPTKE